MPTDRKKKTKIVSILSTSLVMHAHSFKVYHNTKQRKKQLSKCYEWTCFFVRQLNTLLMFERCHWSSHVRIISQPSNTHFKILFI